MINKLIRMALSVIPVNMKVKKQKGKKAVLAKSNKV